MFIQLFFSNLNTNISYFLKLSLHILKVGMYSVQVYQFAAASVFIRPKMCKPSFIKISQFSLELSYRTGEGSDCCVSWTKPINLNYSRVKKLERSQKSLSNIGTRWNLLDNWTIMKLTGVVLAPSPLRSLSLSLSLFPKIKKQTKNLLFSSNC